MAISRTLTIAEKGGTKEVEVAIATPTQRTDGSYSCCYEIKWPEHPWNGFVCGVDSVQATLLAMNLIAVRLYTSSYHKQGSLRWQSHEEGYGFPLANLAKDLAVGIDAML